MLGKSAGAGTVLLWAKKYPIHLPIVPFPSEMINPKGNYRKVGWLGLGRHVCTLLTGLLAPSLGMKPHRSPAPIYWANGIAGIKETNCQFRGQLGNQLISKYSYKKTENYAAENENIQNAERESFKLSEQVIKACSDYTDTFLVIGYTKKDREKFFPFIRR